MEISSLINSLHCGRKVACRMCIKKQFIVDVKSNDVCTIQHTYNEDEKLKVQYRIRSVNPVILCPQNSHNISHHKYLSSEYVLEKHQKSARKDRLTLPLGFNDCSAVRGQRSQCDSNRPWTRSI